MRNHKKAEQNLNSEECKKEIELIINVPNWWKCSHTHKHTDTQNDHYTFSVCLGKFLSHPSSLVSFLSHSRLSTQPLAHCSASLAGVYKRSCKFTWSMLNCCQWRASFSFTSWGCNMSASNASLGYSVDAGWSERGLNTSWNILLWIFTLEEWSVSERAKHLATRKHKTESPNWPMVCDYWKMFRANSPSSPVFSHSGYPLGLHIIMILRMDVH